MYMIAVGNCVVWVYYVLYSECCRAWVFFQTDIVAIVMLCVICMPYMKCGLQGQDMGIEDQTTRGYVGVVSA
jgi:hypothetical protein